MSIGKTRELWMVFWDACKETPKGMAMPFIVVYQAVSKWIHHS